MQGRDTQRMTRRRFGRTVKEFAMITIGDTVFKVRIDKRHAGRIRIETNTDRNTEITITSGETV